MTRPTDHYKTLGVSKRATQKEIRKAFRDLVHTWHPDVSQEPNATTKFQEINDAYQTLFNPKRRTEYDLSQGRRLTQTPRDQAKEQFHRAAQDEQRARVAKRAKEQMTRGARKRVALEEIQLRSEICPKCEGRKRPGFATCINCRPDGERCPLCKGFKRRQYRTCYRCANGGRA